MKSKRSWLAAGIFAVLMLAGSTGTPAQNRIPEHLSGLINDYTPSNVAGGPYEMRGKWSLRLHHESHTADFSAFMNMETSDYGISDGNVDPTNPDTRGAHTHHITMTGTISYDTSLCPSFKAPAPTPVFMVSNTASITGNGSPAPFEKTGPSTLEVCVYGGTEVAFSNITLQLIGPATGHFGSQAIHGVVRFPRNSNEGDHDRDNDKH
ncbi:MAG TPA: hypothetical protein VLY23_12575 [Candidatus Acidoferrum sp.]|nr:hypothetical protein [Candidatus Acidoferrum sp.]